MKNPRIDEYGDKRWYNDEGLLHREDGPAIEWRDGTKYWCINDELYRLDGPAVEWDNGEKSWYYNNKFIGSSRYGFTQEKFERYLRELKIKEYW